jgi:probable HAF family extracellular repeat protein
VKIAFLNRRSRGGCRFELLSFGNFIAEHGFIFDGTVFTGFDAPDSFSIDAFSTEAFDINDAGTIVGTYTDSSSQKHWFVYDGTTFSDINSPDGTIQFVTGINDAGLIVGRYVDASGVHGFVGTPMPASIPEPSTMTLLAMALGLMIRRLRGGRAGQQVRLTASAAGSAREAPHS